MNKKLVRRVGVKAYTDHLSSPENIKVCFGQRIRVLRKKRSLSQEALAFECDLDRTYISSIERGKRNVSLENIQRLASALHVSIYELFYGM